MLYSFFRFLIKLWPFNKGRSFLHNIYFSLDKRRGFHIIKGENFKFTADLSTFLGRHLYLFHKDYEKKEIEFIRNYIKPNDVFLDIGANFGFYSLFVSSLDKFKGKVVAFEAVPAIFNDLRQNVEMNNLENVLMLNYGLADKDQMLEMKLHPTNYGGSSFVKDLSDFSDVKTIFIPCKKLIDLLKSNNITKVDFIKIDIEGFEYKVLDSFFSEARGTELMPNLILTEYHEKMKDLAGGSSVELIKKAGYTLLKQDGINYYFVKEGINY